MCPTLLLLLSWSCKVKSTFRLLKVDTHGKFELPELDHVFNSRKPSWGRLKFMAMTDLLDPNNGYLKDDKLTFEVHIAADAPEGTW
ncbi:hypothetical protein V1264_003262 [Littorina saxatilis]|uniref:MATH domain-containing protein n=1 Tax=Littorina saxatilis TaxID=31220 RepID=A0AAN9B701_9CAEN